ncbi:hypothetical protein COLO4_31801 [Corchorus olitorius]|uniref:F-box domain-containing protein n=1 Tax=Corchorus olitorius TaxID=93759 RepID=A0A1R3H378_9ROSI|nr:hypothetical protein COLO4_31801 [Corchorus olitorius]
MGLICYRLFRFRVYSWEMVAIGGTGTGADGILLSFVQILCPALLLLVCKDNNLITMVETSKMKKVKTSVTTSAAETIGHNPDLLTQILLRLPTKPLLKFKRVSKQWLSLISSPDFCLSHTRHHNQTDGFLKPTSLLLDWRYTSSSEFMFASLKHISEVPVFDFLNCPNIDMLDSCNGLFLCECTFHSPRFIVKYFICNPTTRKFKELLFPALAPYDFTASLAFDPLKSPHYKIIFVSKLSVEENTTFQLDLYSSETDSWSVSKMWFIRENSNFVRFKDSLFWNGKIYWNRRGSRSLYFDIENESLEVMQMSPISTRDIFVQRIGECQGVLCLAVICRAATCLELNVFEMPCDSSCWLLKHHLCIGDSERGFPEVFKHYYMHNPQFSDISMIHFGKENEPKILVWIEDEIVFYDFEDGKWKSFSDVLPEVNIDSVGDFNHHTTLSVQSIRAYKYYENLSSV